MKWSGMKIASGALVLLALASMLIGCGFKRKLIAIEVQPPAATFLSPNPAAQIDFTALGFYLHPPDTHDITSRATWKTDVPQLVTVNGGVVSPASGCGIANISASVQDSGNLVIGYATVTVNDPTNPNCPGGSTTQGVVTVGLTGPGTVTSSPGGINCPTGACGAQFAVGTTIALTATPNTGNTFVGWGSCPQPNGTTCSVPVVTGTTALTATFN